MAFLKKICDSRYPPEIDNVSDTESSSSLNVISQFVIHSDGIITNDNLIFNQQQTTSGAAHGNPRF